MNPRRHSEGDNSHVYVHANEGIDAISTCTSVCGAYIVEKIEEVSKRNNNNNSYYYYYYYLYLYRMSRKIRQHVQESV